VAWRHSETLSSKFFDFDLFVRQYITEQFENDKAAPTSRGFFDLHHGDAMKHSFALVTGTTSGLGYAAARMLATKGYRQVIVTGRSLARVQETAAQLAAETKTKVFSPLELDLDKPSSVESALAELVKRGVPIEFLLLNAGLMPGKTRVVTSENIESSQAPLIGHHQLTMGLLGAGLLAPDARIVIAGAEPARGDVPMFQFTDLAAFAAKQYKGDRVSAIEAILRGSPNVKYKPYVAYSDAKIFIAWWVAALARRLPAEMAVYAVSPGSAPDTQAPRNLGFVMKRLMLPIAKLIPGMAHSVDDGANRYLTASAFGVDVSGKFFASPPKKMTGPIEAMRHQHLHDRANQDALWQAVVKVSGVDFRSTLSAG
jgi:NAD(P)-dependent dehydrogenase (short-subunit alcohol dehydrogenase family)